jgi:hypothetical protein
MFEAILQKSGNYYLKKMKKEEFNLTLERGVTITVIEILSLVLNFSNLFFIRKEEREKGEQAKYFEFSDEEGDFFFLDNIYRKYKKLKDQNDF